MPIVDIAGAPHAYELTESVNSKETLVFIHGWLLSRCYWQPLIEKLSSNYQCLAYDLRGWAQDPIMEPKYVNHLASFHSLFQGCGENVLEIPNCGHLAMLEQTDAVASQIHRILDRYS
jgi:pimeloyl-ACP methyl ester carboxylesterase